MQVCVPSTPAQMYHMIRRQILRSLRKPLIVMTPKSLLRHELSVSSLEDLANGEFANVIDEVDKLTPANVRRVVLSSGKVYFDLLKARRATANAEVALVRVEQLYPFPVPEMESVLAKYPNAREVVWCQEEPQNQGAWYQIRHRLATLVGKRAAVRGPCSGGRTCDRHQQDARSGTARAHRSGIERHQQRRRGARDQAPHDDTRAGCCRHVALREEACPLKSRFPNYPSPWPMPHSLPGTSRSARR
jgi:2-oxoglutarate dehydrogenase complex dehydrogenase (E1) component-like enzyme